MQEKNHKPLWQPLPIFLFILFFGTLSTMDGSDLRTNHLNHLPDKSEKSNIEWIHPPAVPFQVVQEAPTYPVIVWDKTFGGSMSDFLYNALPTPDGGYLLVGGSGSDAEADKSENRKGEYLDYWIVKIDAEGNKIWDKTLGGEREDRPQMALPTPDGGYLLLGSSISNTGGDKSEDNKSDLWYQFDFWIVKIDAEGNKVWDKTIGGDNNDTFHDALPTPDGGYLLAGYSGSDISGDKSEDSKGRNDFWIVKIDAEGNKLWDKTIGGSDTDDLHSIVSTYDGGYLLAGTSASNASGDKSEDRKGGGTYIPTDYWIVKVDDEGNKIWDKTIGGGNTEELYDALSTPDGGYLLAGSSYSDISGDKSETTRGRNDYWVVKIDTEGNVIWDKTLGGEDYDNLQSALPTSDGGYLLAGFSQSEKSGDKSEERKVEHGSQNDYWIVKIDAAGNKVWDKTLGVEGYDNLYSVLPASDGGYLLAGYSQGDSFGDKSELSRGEYDYWVVKIKEQSTPVIKNLTLVDAETDQETQVLREGNVLIQRDKLLNIRAITYPEMIDRVAFTLTGPVTHSQVEKTAPYALFGDIPTGDYGGMALPAGMYTLTVTPYVQDRKGTELMLSFQVEEEDSDGPTLGWDRAYGGNNTDDVKQILSIPDGGYLVAGVSISRASGDKSEGWINGDSPDLWVLKIDESGNKIWDRTLGSNYTDFFGSAALTPDGGFLLAGTAVSIDYARYDDENYLIIKIDAEGDVVWDKILGGSDDERLYSVVPSPGGGYLLAGNSESNISYDKSENNKGVNDYWVVKIDESGNKVWDKTFGGNKNDTLTHALATPDDGYLLAGSSYSDVSGDKSENTKGKGDYWVVKIDADGNKVWDKTFGGNKNDSLNWALATSDGGYLLAGSSYSDASGDKSEPRRGNYDYWVVKIDADGNKVWDKTIGGNKFDYLYHALTTPDGNYLLTGYSESNATGDKSENNKGLGDGWVVKIDTEGNIIWDKAIGGEKYDILVSATLTPNGSFLLTGTSNDNTEHGPYNDYWIIELKDDAAPIGPAVTSLTLIDAKTDEDIQTLKQGDVITEAGALNIRANTSGPVDHVVLELQGPLHHKRTEEVAPYALFGDIPTGDYAGKQLPAGMYTVTVTPFSQGQKGNAMKISFEVTDAVAIRSFTLINATQDQAAGELSQGDVIDLAAFGNHQLNIRANTQPMQVEQVTFSLQGPMNRSRTEGVAPYALFGDSSAPDGSPDYDGLKMKVGTYTLTVTPYADGSMGIASTITFTVIDSRNAASRQTRVYPVPTSGTIHILHDGGEETQMFLLDFRGNKLLTQSSSAQPIEQLDLSGFKKGVYYLKIISAEGVQIFRVVKE